MIKEIPTPADFRQIGLDYLNLAWKGLKKSAAIADDDITVKEYGADLDANLARLVERLKQKRYRSRYRQKSDVCIRARWDKPMRKRVQPRNRIRENRKSGGVWWCRVTGIPTTTAVFLN